LVDEHGEFVEPIARYLNYLDLCGKARNTLRTYARSLAFCFTFLRQRGLSYERVQIADQVVSMVDLPGCPGAHGVAIDADQRLAFVACQKNAKLVALDLQTMQVVFTGDVGKNPDVLALDPSQHRVYVAAESDR
jgi:DNA-binding beta-propeller fold protein YncE